MNRSDGFLRWAQSVLVIFMLALALGACSDGEDGLDGCDGVTCTYGVEGADCTAGSSATLTPLSRRG